MVATKFLPRTQGEIDAGVTGQQHIEPVSYTHLDVYKRQAFARLGERVQIRIPDKVLRKRGVGASLAENILFIKGCLLYTSRCV